MVLLGKKAVIPLLILLLTAVLLFGCTQNMANTGSGYMGLDANKKVDSNVNADKNAQVFNNTGAVQKVKAGDHISVNYTGRLTDGTIFDTSVGKTPLDFNVGAGQMIKGFDSAVIGMKVGETKTVTLSPSQAYGELDPKAIVTFDANQFAGFSSLTVGTTVSAGSGMQGTVVEKTDKNATIDFNPPLAGKTLIFDITIVSIN